MNQLESPARKLQKQNDYRRHKLFRKIKRRNRAEAEQAMNAATKALQKKLKKPSYNGGKCK